MSLLVRSWNVFHGNASPPRRRGYLREMVELVTRDRPDVVCLQELPVWALPRIDNWSTMDRFHAVARQPWRIGPLAGVLTRVNVGLLRSALTGQANAILVRQGADTESLGSIQVSVDDGRERRVCHAVRVENVVVATTHLSSPADTRGQQDELARCAAWLESVAREGDGLVIAGDLNVRQPILDGWSPGAPPGIDHVLAKGIPCSPLTVWPTEQRRLAHIVLSDHPPVEAVVG